MRLNARGLRHRLGSDRGAALVEFALVLPLVAMLLVGTVSAGLAWSKKLSLDHAGREAARYGTTLPDNQFGTGAGSAWASDIASKVRERANGDLDVAGTTVCVALVTGTTSATVYSAPSGGTAYWYSGSYPYSSSTGTAAPCFDDHGADGNRRVQVRITRPEEIDAVVFRASVTLVGQATARFEF